MLQSDFMIAVNQISAERGIEVSDILDSIKQAIKSGFRRDYTDEEDNSSLNVEISPETGQISVFVDKKVVEEVTDESSQIALKEAQKLEPRLRVGDHVEVDITPDGDFGRVAAQTAKQVMLQKLREAEKEAHIKKFIDRIGEIEVGIVQRMEKDTVVWEVGRTPAYMPPSERVPSEFYKSGMKHKVLIKEISDSSKGRRIIVSRACNEFLKALFEIEIPELTSNTIEIKSIAREAGQRSKVAVTSNVEGIDPIGACVGQKGVRIMSIMNELKLGRTEEKVDIILWDENQEEFVANALSPAQVVSARILDKKEKIMKVIVPDEQLSLAIGRDGQNVRLAAKLTGWNIDIQGETVAVDSSLTKVDKEQEDTEEVDVVIDEGKEKKKQATAPKTKKDDISNLDIAKRTLSALQKAGITSIKELKKLIKKGDKIEGIGPKAVEEIKSAI